MSENKVLTHAKYPRKSALRTYAKFLNKSQYIILPRFKTDELIIATMFHPSMPEQDLKNIVGL